MSARIQYAVLGLTLTWLNAGLAALAHEPVNPAEEPFGPDIQWPPPHERGPHDAPAPPDALRRTSPPGDARGDRNFSVQVNVDANGNNIVGDAANEPTLAIDPLRPYHLVIGWRQFDSIQSNFREAGYAYSRDAGHHWTFPGVLQQNVFRSDPVLGADTLGYFYFCSLTNSDPYTCQMFKSTNHGVTFTGPIQAYGGDKEWMAIDRTGGMGNNNLYIAWDYASCCGNNWFTRSTDGGQTYMSPIPIPQQPYWGTVAVGPDGELYICGRTTDYSNSVFYCVKSLNAKNPAVTPTFQTPVLVNLGGSLEYYLGDGSPNPAGLLGQVWIAVNQSTGPNRGHVYILSSINPSGGDPLNVHFVRSIDGGATWSSPIRINDDPTGTNAWQWFGTLSVGPSGRLDAVWYDTRNGPDYHWSRVYYSYSTDDGLTWSPNVALTGSFNTYLGWPQQNKLGDYIHMISDDVGASLAYAATFNGEEDIYFLRIGDDDCNGNGVADPVDLANGTLTDLNHDGIPDQCQGLGDMNCDDRVDFADIDPFVLALSDRPAYEAQFPNCRWLNGDINGDGAVNFGDIDPFVALLSGGA